MNNREEENLTTEGIVVEAKKLTLLGGKLERFELALGSTLLAVIVVSVLLDVVFREAGVPILWVEDFTRFIFLWTLFFGASIGYRRGTHYRIELLPAATPFWVIRVFEVLVFLCEIVFIGLLLIDGYKFALLAKDRVAMPSGMPIIYQVISIPLAAVFMLYYWFELVKAWSSKH